MQIYTIGHSNHSPEAFLNLLTEVNIEVLVDVRSNPNSRWAPFTSVNSLKEILKSAQIQYIYLGDVLGGRPSGPDSYDLQTGKADYQAIQQQGDFQQGIKRLLEGLKRYRTCIMCAEEDPGSCHRNLLVAGSLRQEGVVILHIRGDGRIQTDDDLWKEKIGIPANQYTLPL